MGPAFDRPGAVHEVCDAAYRGGLLTETAGPHDEVAKALPPLTVADGQLEQGRGCSTRPSAIAVLASLTALPALLAKLGRWVDRPRVPFL